MCAKKTGRIEDLAVVGIDIGKDTFHLVGFDRSGLLVIRKQIKRLALNATFEGLPRCIVAMEACLSAHFVSRTLRGMGFDPRIIPAIYVKPFNKGQKNDYNDAEAIAEAALAPKPPDRFRERPRSTRPSGSAPGSGAAGFATHGHHQPDPGLSHRAGDHRQVGAPGAEEILRDDPRSATG